MSLGNGDMRALANRVAQRISREVRALGNSGIAAMVTDEHFMTSLIFEEVADFFDSEVPDGN